MSQEPAKSKSFSRFRRLGIALNVIITVVCLFGIVAMFNYLSSRYYYRYQMVDSSRVDLSPMTRGLLQSLTNTVNVYSYYDAFDSGDPLQGHVDLMLKEYARISRFISLRSVDNLLNPSAATEIKNRFNLTEQNVVVFECEGRWRKVTEAELADYLPVPVTRPDAEFERKMVAFRGEQVFTSALLSVLDPAPLKAYFVTGHGEHSHELEEPGRGYSHFAAMLAENNITNALLQLESGEIPADCKLLVIAGPIRPLPLESVDKIDRYLAQGGRAFISFNYQSFASGPTGLEKLLARWGVAVGANVLDDNDASSGYIVYDFGSHPISNPLMGHALTLLYPRSVTPIQRGASAADLPRVSILAQGPVESRWMETFSPKGAPQKSDRDRIGPGPVAVAVEKGNLQGVTTERGATRMVVLGDSISLANEMIDGSSNEDFARLSINWLADRSQLVSGIGPKPVKEYRVNLKPGQIKRLRWLLIAGIPGSVLLIGLGVWLVRRS